VEREQEIVEKLSISMQQYQAELRDGNDGYLDRCRELKAQILVFERDLMRMRGNVYVVPLDIGTWNLFSISSVSSSSDVAEIYGEAYGDGTKDVRIVVRDVFACCIAALNDEIYDAHPLRGHGMGMIGAFEVIRSPWKDMFWQQESTHSFCATAAGREWWSGFRHWLFRGKESEVNILARALPVYGSSEVLMGQDAGDGKGSAHGTATRGARE
jgi:hypothetical protein